MPATTIHFLDEEMYYDDNDDGRERTKYRSPTIPASKLFNSSTTSGKQKQKQPQAYADEINVLPEGYDPYTPPDGFPFPIQPPLAPPPAGERVYMPEPETETERRQGVDRAYTQSVPLERRDKSHSGSSGSGSGSGSGRGEGGREGEGTRRRNSLSRAYARLIGRAGGGGERSGAEALADYIANPDHASSSHQHHHRSHSHRTHNTHTHTQSQPTSYPNTRSRSHRSKSPESINALLVLTTERLNQEIARANAAEKVNAEALAHLKSAIVEKRRVEVQLGRAEKELGLYRTQLDVAQNEINRAQEVTNRLQDQLREVEERASRDRDRLRKMIEERVTAAAREEGYRQGLAEARRMGTQWSSSSGSRPGPMEFLYRRPREREGGRERERDGVVDDREGDELVSPVSSSSSGRSRMGSIREYLRPRSRSRAPSRGGERQDPPDVAPMAPPPPMPTVATPITVRVPSTQPAQPQPSRPRPRPTPDPEPVHSPESIAVRNGSSVGPGSTSNLNRSTTNLDDRKNDFHPVPVYNRSRSPALSHRSVVAPPDGYIPTVVDGSSIMLPPPHEMGGSMAMSEPGDEDDGEREQAIRARDYAYRDVQGAGRSRSAMGRPVGAPIIATAPSAASTRISQYDLVSPPRDRERERERYAGRGGAATPTPAPGTGGGLRARSGSVSNGSSKTQPEQIADQWRASNMYRSQTPGASGMYRSQTPGASGIYRSQTPGAASSRRMQFVVRNGDGIERPATTEPVRPDMTMPRSPRVSGGPRLPRQIVPPVPLGNVVTVNSLHHIDVNPQIYDYPYPPRSPPGPSPEQQQRKSSTDSDSSRISNNSNSSGSTRTRSPIDWLRSRFQNARTVTGTTVPNIDVEPPSQSPTTASARTTVVDPVLLSPDHASMNLPPAEPSQDTTYTARDGSLGLYSRPPSRSAGAGIGGGGNADPPIMGVISDNQLPPGFIPLSPIPSISNMNIEGGFEAIANSSSSPSLSNQGNPIGRIYADPNPNPSRPSTAMGVSGPSQTGSGSGSRMHRRANTYGGIYSPLPLELNISAFPVG